MPTYDTTTKHALRHLTGDNPVSDIDAGFEALADDIDSKLTPYTSGLLADRPVSSGGSPGKSGRLYRATDDLTGGANGTLYIDHGTGWLLIGPTTPTWTAPTMEGSWVVVDDLAYCKDHLGFVHIRGAAGGGGGVGGTVFNLPAGYRPVSVRNPQFLVPDFGNAEILLCTVFSDPPLGGGTAGDVAFQKFDTGSGVPSTFAQVHLDSVSFPTW